MAQAFGIRTGSKFFEAINNMIYKEKHESIIRELVSNAVDASKVAGTIKPIHIMIPEYDNQEFYVQDFGIGMTFETFVEVFANYFNSTKENSTDEIGGFGIGGKTPFLYADEFYVTTTSPEDGVRRTFKSYKKSNNEPDFHHFEELDEENSTIKGTKVSFIIKNHDDKRDFINALSQLFFIDYPIVLNNPLSAFGNKFVDLQEHFNSSFNWNKQDIENIKHNGFIKNSVYRNYFSRDYYATIQNAEGNHNNYLEVGVLNENIPYKYQIKNYYDDAAIMSAINKLVVCKKLDLLMSDMTNADLKNFKNTDDNHAAFVYHERLKKELDSSIVLNLKRTDKLELTLSREEIANTQNSDIIIRQKFCELAERLYQEKKQELQVFNRANKINALSAYFIYKYISKSLHIDNQELLDIFQTKLAIERANIEKANVFKSSPIRLYGGMNLNTFMKKVYTLLNDDVANIFSGPEKKGQFSIGLLNTNETNIKKLPQKHLYLHENLKKSSFELTSLFSNLEFKEQTSLNDNWFKELENFIDLLYLQEFSEENENTNYYHSSVFHLLNIINKNIMFVASNKYFEDDVTKNKRKEENLKTHVLKMTSEKFKSNKTINKRRFYIFFEDVKDYKQYEQLENIVNVSCYLNTEDKETENSFIEIEKIKSKKDKIIREHEFTFKPETIKLHNNQYIDDDTLIVLPKVIDLGKNLLLESFVYDVDRFNVFDSKNSEKTLMFIDKFNEHILSKMKHQQYEHLYNLLNKRNQSNSLTNYNIKFVDEDEYEKMIEKGLIENHPLKQLVRSFNNVTKVVFTLASQLKADTSNLMFVKNDILTEQSGFDFHDYEKVSMTYSINDDMYEFEVDFKHDFVQPIKIEFIEKCSELLRNRVVREFPNLDLDNNQIWDKYTQLEHHEKTSILKKIIPVNNNIIKHKHNLDCINSDLMKELFDDKLTFKKQAEILERFEQSFSLFYRVKDNFSLRQEIRNTSLCDEVEKKIIDKMKMYYNACEKKVFGLNLNKEMDIDKAYIGYDNIKKMFQNIVLNAYFGTLNI